MARKTETADEVQSDIKAAVDEVQADLKAGVRRVVEDARHTASRLADNEALDRLRERGADMADNARAEAERLYAEGQRRAGEAVHYAEDRYEDFSGVVKRHPIQSLGIAAGVGFLLGLLYARR